MLQLVWETQQPWFALIGLIHLSCTPASTLAYSFLRLWSVYPMYQIEFSGMSVPIYLAVTCKFCVFVNLTQLSLQYLKSLVCLLEWFECDGAVWFRRHHSSTGRRTEGHKDVLDCLQGIQGLAMRRQFSIFESNISWNCFLQVDTSIILATSLIIKIVCWEYKLLGVIPCSAGNHARRLNYISSLAQFPRRFDIIFLIYH